MDNRVVLVTGASSGIGRACAVLLAERGFRVYGTSRSAAPQSEAIRPGGGAQHEISMLALDVKDERSVAAAIETILTREGRLDIVINNAGMGIAGSIEDTSIEEAKRQFDVNFFGVLRVCRAALPAMRRQGSGYIVNVGSIGGLIALPYQGLYSASKFALEGLTEALRLEAAPHGIRVVLIEPGDHKTGFTENRRSTAGSATNEAYQRSFSSALRRMAEDEQNGPGPERVAHRVLKIVTSSRPRLRYTMGPAPQRTAVWLKRLLPYWLIERGVRIYYGI